MTLDPKIPSGPLAEKWDRRRQELKLVAPANKRKYRIIVVGTGLAGAAAASLGELGYNVDAFCFQDSPRRAHSISAQGGINAAKNYPNDGDSIERLFLDTIKGGDFRSREANVYRLASVSANIIDQCVAQGVPFARDYAGYLATRSFGGAQVSRTFYARGQTGQQLLLGAYCALMRQVKVGTVRMHPRTEMLALVVVDGRAKGIMVRDLVTGKIESFAADAVCLATGGYTNVFYLSTNAQGSNVTATYRAYKKGAFFANPCFTQIHPTCIPVTGEHQAKLTLMSESLRNDGRVWVPKKKGDTRSPGDIPEAERVLQHTFDEVNRHFGQLFPALFGGGHARLVLTGEEILDAGVQVTAQPPGKKNTTIHLLSGGEKALTALALVFSMFQLNPAPFCLLDEVDAPLDDHNTERFCELVRTMSQNSQFLFISHNKITMEIAEQLLGITMQEAGVSRVVAVDIEEAMKLSEAAA